MRETLIYGLAKEDTADYMEQLLATNCKTPSDIVKVKAAASAQGFHSFRVAYYNGEAPNFAATVSV